MAALLYIWPWSSPIPATTSGHLRVARLRAKRARMRCLPMAAHERRERLL